MEGDPRGSPWTTARICFLFVPRCLSASSCMSCFLIARKIAAWHTLAGWVQTRPFHLPRNAREGKSFARGTCSHQLHLTSVLLEPQTMEYTRMLDLFGFRGSCIQVVLNTHLTGHIPSDARSGQRVRRSDARMVDRLFGSQDSASSWYHRVR